MKIFLRVFRPTKNRRLNELVGLLLFASAILLLVALVSYSPLDPSLNTAATPPAFRPTHNWAGVFGAYVADLLLQVEGITIFLLPVMMGMLAMRWFKSRDVLSPIAKSIGSVTLLMFLPAFLSLLPWHLKLKQVIAIEGLTGRVVGDALTYWFNLVGAYIVCISIIAAALYLSTTFSITAARLWLETRFAFVFAAWQRFLDWREARARERSRREVEKRHAVKPVVTAQLVPARREVAPPAPPVRTGIDRMAEEEDGSPAA